MELTLRHVRRVGPDARERTTAALETLRLLVEGFPGTWPDRVLPLDDECDECSAMGLRVPVCRAPLHVLRTLCGLSGGLASAAPRVVLLGEPPRTAPAAGPRAARPPTGPPPAPARHPPRLPRARPPP